MIDALIWIGFGLMIAFGIALTFALCIAAEDEETRREQWSRTLDEEDYFKVKPPEFLKKDESATDTNVGNRSLDEKEKK